MAFYLGNPGGSTLVRSPDRGWDATAAIPSTVARTIGGGQLVSMAPAPGRRVFEAAWSILLPADFSVLEEFFLGVRGQPPFALLDPVHTNRLTADQSAGSAVAGDTSGWLAGPAETLTPSAALLDGQLAASLRWSLPAAGAGGVLRWAPPATIASTPAPAGLPWTFSVRAAALGPSAGQVTAQAVLYWLDAAGQTVDVTVGTAATLGQFADYTVSAPGPLGAGVQAALVVDVSTLVGGDDAPVRGWPFATPPRRAAAVGPMPYPVNVYNPAGLAALDVYVGKASLSADPAPVPWVLGGGVPMVRITALPERVRVVTGRDTKATFVEVG